VGVVNVEMDAFEDVLDIRVGDFGSIEEVFTGDVQTTAEDLSGNSQYIILLVPRRGVFW